MGNDQGNTKKSNDHKQQAPGANKDQQFPNADHNKGGQPKQATPQPQPAKSDKR